jgi:acetolactate synthase-1/2/3 large subunit
MSRSESAIRIVRENESLPAPKKPLPRTATYTRSRKALVMLHHTETDEQPPDQELKPSSSLPKDCAAMRMVDVLVARGVTTFFGIPGGPICPFFEALRLNDSVELVESRHENHAAFAAAAYYRATGRTACVVVTAGPGVTNAVTGIASAYMERVPMLVISGDVAWASHGGRLAQNSGPEGLNMERLLSPITVRQIRVTNGPSAVSQTLAALNAAEDQSGPALLVLPIDRATQPAPLFEVPAARKTRTIGPDPETVRKTAKWLAEAERPLLVLGAGCLGAATWVRQLVDALDVPFVTTPRAKGVVSEEHPRSLRNGGMAASLWARDYTSKGVDVALVLGSDLDDTSVGPTPYIGRGGKLIHVDLDPQVFNRNLPTQLGVTADLAHFSNDLYELVVAEGLRNGRGRRLIKETQARAPYDVPDFRSSIGLHIPPHRAIADLQAAAAPNARFVTDIGEHMLFALHYLTARGPQDFHIQLNLGSMGSGIAGATGLALADRTRPVVCICGDGGMQMSGMEILTSAKLGLPVLYAVFNDSRYNMVHHGMRQIFGEAADFSTPTTDFSAWAQAMGIPAVTIRRSGELTADVVSRLMVRGGPALLDIRIDRDVRLNAGGRVEALQHMSMLMQEREVSPS